MQSIDAVRFVGPKQLSLTSVLLGFVRWVAPFRVETLPDPLQDVRDIKPLVLGVRVGHMPGEIDEHDPPRRRVLPNLGAKDHVLLAFPGPDPSELDSLAVLLGPGQDW